MIKTQETKDLLQEIRMSDMHDGYGVCMAWMFSISDYLTFNTEGFPPFKWGYVPAMGGPETESYEYEVLLDLNYTYQELSQVVEIVGRWYDLLIAAKRDY